MMVVKFPFMLCKEFCCKDHAAMRTIKNKLFSVV